MSIPAELALTVYMKRDTLDREDLIDKAQELGEVGIFSQRQIIDITGLPAWVVRKEVPKPNKVGGIFNPEMLPLIYDFALSLEGRPSMSVPNLGLLQVILGQGVSMRFLGKLIGVSNSTIQYWAKSLAKTDVR